MTGALRRCGYLAGALIAALAWVRPAAAAPWYDGGAAAPVSIHFTSVAAYRAANGDDVVVAVGQDTMNRQAVIYRRVGGVWSQDVAASLSDGVDLDSCLTGVAVTPQGAWAVGSQDGGCPGSTGGMPRALILAYPGGGGALATPGPSTSTHGWQVVQPSPGDMSPLDYVALAGSAGYVASKGGPIYSVADVNSPTFNLLNGSGATPPQPASVSGLAAYGGGGFAVGDSTGASGIRIFSLSQTGAQPAPANPPTTSTPLGGVAALGGSAAIAVEAGSCPGGGAPGYWYSKTGLWQRDAAAPFPAGTQPDSVAMAGSTATATEAIAGSAPDPGGAGCHGVVWYRNGDPTSTGGWQSSDSTGPLGPSLHGIAVVDSTDMWAVGDAGTVVRYYNPPPPPPPPPPPAGQQSAGTSTPTSATSSAAPRSATSQPQVIVDQPPPTKPPGGKGPARRLLSHVRVKVERGRLIVTFLLTARARVRIEPRTAGRLIGAARTRVLGKGRRRMVVTYRGDLPPAQLRIVARPAKKSCSSKRKRSRGGHCAQAKTV